MKQVVSGKGDSTGKLEWECLEDFSGMFHKKMNFFLQTSVEHFCQTNPIQVMLLVKSNFFQKSTGCHAVAAKSLFPWQKIDRKYLFWENCFDRFQFKFLESFKVVLGLVWLKRTCVFSGIQFTEHFIDFFVETNQLFGSNSNVILTRQTCGQRSGMAAESKRRGLAFYFPVLICYMLPLSKWRGEWESNLCMTSGLAKRMPLRSGEFWRMKSALRSHILFASPEVMHTPKLDYFVHFHIRNI